MYVLYSKVFKASIRAKQKKNGTKINVTQESIISFSLKKMHTMSLNFLKNRKWDSWDKGAARSKSLFGVSSVVILAAAWKLIQEFVNE